LSYGQLRQKAQAIAAGIAHRTGGCESAPIGLRLEDGLDFLAAFLAVTEAGGIAVPVHTRWTASETAVAVDLCKPRLCISDARGAALGVDTVTLNELEREGGGGPVSPAGSDDPFYIGFSSGSSGTPKAIVRNHRAWLQSFLAMTAEFGVGPGGRVAIPGSLFYSFSLIAALQALYVGASVLLPARRGIRGALELLNDRPLTLYALPSLLAEVLRAAERRSSRFPAVETIICAGEKLRAETRQAAVGIFPNAAVLEYYGASELGFVTVIDGCEASARPDSVGRRFLGTNVAILDEGGQAMPSGAIGLLCAQTEYGYAGYAGRPGQEAETAHHGWQTVGDLAWQDDAGYVYLAGRRDNMVVIRGENVYPEEVERVISGLFGVKEAAVVPEPPGAPTHLAALIVARAGGTDAGTILAACRRRLSPRKVPRRVVFVPGLPRTATGKLARAELPPMLGMPCGDAE
jgi:long-chain acyl-CoA synthetase